MKLVTNKIKKILKISEPFLMIDEFKIIKSGKSALGIKKINMNEWFFKSHFTDDPTMPSTLITEAMLQTNVLILYLKNKNNSNKIFITKSSVNNFNKINSEGEININANIESEKNGMIKAKSEVFFNKKMVAKGVFNYIDPVFFNLKKNK